MEKGGHKQKTKGERDMKGMQKVAHEQLKDILSRISEGAYGTDDDFDDLALEEDLTEVSDKVYLTKD